MLMVDINTLNYTSDCQLRSVCILYKKFQLFQHNSVCVRWYRLNDFNQFFSTYTSGNFTKYPRFCDHDYFAAVSKWVTFSYDWNENSQYTYRGFALKYGCIWTATDFKQQRLTIFCLPFQQPLSWNIRRILWIAYCKTHTQHDTHYHHFFICCLPKDILLYIMNDLLTEHVTNQLLK